MPVPGSCVIVAATACALAACDRGFTLVDRRAQVVEVADRAHEIDAVAVEHGDPGAVVAAVLEFLESVEQQRSHLPRSDIADDAAHEPEST